MTPNPRALALIREAETTTTLLVEGVSMIVRPDWRLSSGAAAWTCLASGAERLLKLTIGLSAEADGLPWPADEIRHTYAHRLLLLRPDVDRALGERLGRAPAAAYIASLVELVAGDPYLPTIFEALAQWSDSTGRYRDFEMLAGHEVQRNGPAATWEAAERLTWTARPDVLEGLAMPDNRSALVTMRSELAGSVLRWWFLHYRAWAHGVFGPVAKQHSSSLDPRDIGAIRALTSRLLTGL
ncbi:hypothetical protein GCM10022399_19930 [Terrabacter ginsenosidimutans]|uniref:Uncharacterized protein n=1 Tax=Terrabacter ginsenosidimutans TaxID=490575 RepID=A0ABP7DEN8_9MICO